MYVNGHAHKHGRQQRENVCLNQDDDDFQQRDADRQRQETALQAASPMRAGADQESTIGLGLFDTADQPAFRLDDGGGERPLKDILDEIDSDAAAVDAAKGCLL